MTRLAWWRPPYNISPVWMRRFNGVSVIAWLIITVVQNFTNWAQSVAYVSNLSTWALVMSSLGAYLSARVEVAQADTDVPTDVVEALVENTEISKEPRGGT